MHEARDGEVGFKYHFHYDNGGIQRWIKASDVGFVRLKVNPQKDGVIPVFIADAPGGKCTIWWKID